MKLSELMRQLGMQFFVTYTCTMFASFFFTQASDPKMDMLPTVYLMQAALFSLGATLPGLVYYSKKELTRRQLLLRDLLHTVLLEAVLLYAGHKIGMYRGIGGFFAFFGTVLVVDLIVRLVTYLNDKSTTDKINDLLRSRREGGGEE